MLRESVANMGVKVLLVGEGGEVLSGYGLFIYPYLSSLRNENECEEFEDALIWAEEFLCIKKENIY